MGRLGLHHHLRALRLLVSGLALVLLSQTAAAAPSNEDLRGSVVRPPPSRFHAGTNTGSRLLFLNRCVGGCVIEPGFEDSRSNHSSIIETTRNISEFKHSDQDWNTVVQCVRELYAPFDVIVTDVDPGQVEHSEAIVAGTAVEAGFLGAGGVAPFTCGFIDNAITFTFASNYENLRTICNVVGQESAHAFGLDHELECKDPLTYLRGCPLKSFQDTDALCGENIPRSCECGGSTQNSFQYLDELFGPGIAPTVEIITPQDMSRVDVGFVVQSTATDDGPTMYSELWIDGSLVERKDAAPYDFRAPTTLPSGPHEVEVRVFDDRSVYGSQTILIEQDDCTSRSQCDFSYLCLGGQCTLGPGNTAGLGEPCNQSDDCQSSVCARERNLPRVCTAFCDRAPESCPDGYACDFSSDGRRVCMIDIPAAGGGFCSGHGGRSSGLATVMLLFCLLCGTRMSHGKARNRRP